MMYYIKQLLWNVVINVTFISIAGEGLYQLIIKRRQYLTQSSDEYCDIIDGQLYKDLFSSDDLNEHFLTFTINTDGITVLHSSNWPVYLTVNELPFHLRLGWWLIIFIKRNFYIVDLLRKTFGGLWYGSVKPDMTLFLGPVAKALTKLSKHGKKCI